MKCFWSVRTFCVIGIRTTRVRQTEMQKTIHRDLQLELLGSWWGKQKVNNFCFFCCQLDLTAVQKLRLWLTIKSKLISCITQKRSTWLAPAWQATGAGAQIRQCRLPSKQHWYQNPSQEFPSSLQPLNCPGPMLLNANCCIQRRMVTGENH